MSGQNIKNSVFLKTAYICLDYRSKSMPYLCHHSYGATDPDPRLHLSDDCFDSYSPWFSVSLFHFLPQRKREAGDNALLCPQSCLIREAAESFCLRAESIWRHLIRDIILAFYEKLESKWLDS